MTKKLEYAEPVYYCGLKQILGDHWKSSYCLMSPYPDCRRCSDRKELEQKVEYKKYREREGIPI